MPNPFAQELERRRNPFAEELQRRRPAGTAANIARQVGQGLTFGFADELEAAARAPFSDRSREDIQAEIRAQNRAYERENPIASTATQLAAGLATGGVGAGRVAGMKAIQAMPRLLRWAGGGAAGGAAAGAGYAEDDKAAGAALGGAVGAVGGVAIPAMIGAITRLGKPAAQQILDRIGRDPKQVAQRKVLEALDRDRLTPEQAITRLRELGEEGTLADVSPNVSGLAEAVATRPGRALETATDAFTQRRAGQANRILAEFDDVVGQPRALAVTETGPEWQRALSQEVRLDPKMGQLLSRPSLKQAWARAQRLAAEQDQRLPSHEQLVKAIDGGDLQGMSTQVMHWLKKGLDDVLEAKRDPVTGKLPTARNDVRAIQATRSAFRSLVKERNPDYGRLLDRTAISKRLETAHDKGAAFMRLKSPEAVRAQLNSFKNDLEKQEYRRGIRDAIENSIANDAERGYDTTRKVLGQANKIRAAFGQEQGDRLIAMVKRERGMAQTEGRVLGGSRTAMRQAAMEGAADDPGALDVGALSQFGRDLAWGSNPIIAALSAGGRALGRNLQGRNIPQPVADELGGLLFQRGTPATAARLASILAARGRLPNAPVVSPALATALIQQQGRAVAP